MKRYTRLLCLLLAALLLLSGCGSGAATSQADSSAQSDTSAADTDVADGNTTDGTEDAAASNGETEDTQDSEFVGGFGIGSDASLVDEEGNAVAIEYTGGELALDYSAWGYGTGSAFGLLLFVDGVPQPFHTDTDSEVAYMHFFTTGDDDGIGDDDDTVYFTLHFTPVTGQAGDTYCVTCYANHHVLTDGENVTQTLTVGKKEVVSLEFDLETSQLEDLTTFYAYICPVSTNTESPGSKTQLILLYQSN